ncbi:MAG TPA: amidohydrolase family protein [Bacteroidia bacterium]|nr:amidohydrolase family protein [Bacteroidia bacterium]
MRFLSADYIFSAHTGFLKDAVLVLDGDNRVIDLTGFHSIAAEKTEKFQGVLCPGFINAHCHLELSHLRGQISKHTGFSGFAKQLMSKRLLFTAEQVYGALKHANDEMFRNGIVAVGDISNTSASFAIKSTCEIFYHTFIELLALDPAKAHSTFNSGKSLLADAPLPCSLTPHAPYSVSPVLLDLVAEDNRQNGNVLSIHNQESLDEEEFLLTGTGPLREFYRYLGIDLSFYRPPGINSLRATLPHLLNDKNLLLVHNTFTSEEDLRWAEKQHKNIWWCFCPNANLYIENRLPDFEMFVSNGARTCVGTDSLASNETLSILEELKIIAARVPSIAPQDLLTWATRNGAEALQLDTYGSFEKNKIPGVNLLSGITPEAISAMAEVCRII